jgi:hypothetical protein
MDTEQTRSEPKPNLIDVIIILVISSAIALFVFWLATRSMDRTTFEQLPEWLRGSFGAIFSVITGSTGIGAAVLHELRRPPNTSPNYFKLIGWCMVALFAMILIIILIIRFVIPAPIPSPSPTPSSSPKTFKICFGEGGVATTVWLAPTQSLIAIRCMGGLRKSGISLQEASAATR